ncbi:MAG TPA: hypothetical protein VMH04_04490 [Candidatus Solibacter sp.]|nr:hypothetical protein [Candidatus Solibacter sp.]
MTESSKSSAVVILLAWIFVGIPLSWGIYNTVRNSMKLFQNPTPPAHALVVRSGEVLRS